MKIQFLREVEWLRLQKKPATSLSNASTSAHPTAMTANDSLSPPTAKRPNVIPKKVHEDGGPLEIVMKSEEVKLHQFVC